MKQGLYNCKYGKEIEYDIVMYDCIHNLLRGLILIIN